MKIMNETEKQIMDNLRTKFRKELAHQLKDMMSNEEFVEEYANKFILNDGGGVYCSLYDIAGLIYTGKIDDYIGGQEKEDRSE
jgi:hypothetical protein